MSNEEQNLHEARRPRYQEPDVVVIVGTGDKQKEFKSYRVLLGFASEVFDAMLGTNMKEGDTGKILLPDKDPKEWEIFYAFIDPSTSRNAEVKSANAKFLAPWFHCFQMQEHLEMCDDALPYGLPSRCHGCSITNYLNDLLPYLSLAETYDLEESKEYFWGKLQLLMSANDCELLKNVETLQTIIPILHGEESQKKFLDILKIYLPNSIDTNSSSLEKILQNEFFPHLLKAGLAMRTALNFPKRLFERMPDKKLRGDTVEIDIIAQGKLQSIIKADWGHNGIVDIPSDW